MILKKKQIDNNQTTSKEKFVITQSGIESYNSMKQQNLQHDNYLQKTEEKKLDDRDLEAHLERLTKERDQLFKGATEMTTVPSTNQPTVLEGFSSLPIENSTNENFLSGKTLFENRDEGVFFKKGREDKISK